MKQLIYKGIIEEKDHGDNSCALFLSEYNEPLAELLDSEIYKKQVSVRYFIANQPETRAQLIEGLIQKLYGDAHAIYQDAYSDYTGYLWTDEELKIGGHDLLSELRTHKGKYCYLEIDIL